MTDKERKDLETKLDDFKSKLEKLKEKLSFEQSKEAMLEFQINSFPNEPEWKTQLAYCQKAIQSVQDKIQEVETKISGIEWLLE